MPRTAIISDIHANLHALHAVMEDCQHQQCTDVVCLGDVVGYNAYPAECLDYIRKINCPIVKGNHDEEVVSASMTKMNPMARQAMEWTRAQLSEEQLTWLSRLQYMRVVRHSGASTFSIVHSCLEQPKAWNYIINANDAASNFPKQFSALCFHGHTHVPKVFMWDGRHAAENYEVMQTLYAEGCTEFAPRPGIKYFINVGSVGQPRDHDSRACYAIYDTELNTITLRRVEYDIAAAQQAILSQGLPEYLADRLSKGC